MQALDVSVSAATYALAQRPAALITDIDGTISRIVPRPEDAVVSSVARQALAQLATKLDLVAAVTGREEKVARAMVGLEEIAYVGNYALDREARSEIDLVQLESAKQKAMALLPLLPGVSFEEKGVSFTLHYRNVEQPDEMRVRILTLVEPLAVEAGGRILEGKKVVEVVPRDLPDKGTAVATLLRKNALRGAVYLGDDISDLSVLRELGRLRNDLDLRTLFVAVIDNETPRAIVEAADVRLGSVTEVEQFLQALVVALGESS